MSNRQDQHLPTTWDGVMYAGDIAGQPWLMLQLCE